MKHGLIRLWATGPSEADQRAAVIAAGALPDRIHIDDHRPKRRQKPSGDAERMTPMDHLIRVLRNGDLLVIASAPVLGNSWESVMRVLGWIEERGAVVLDAELGQEIKGVEAGIALADRAKRRLNLLRNGPARRAVQESGVKTGPPKKELGRPFEDLLAMWKKPDEFSVQAIADAAKVSRVTLWKRFRQIPRREEPVTE